MSRQSLGHRGGREYGEHDGLRGIRARIAYKSSRPCALGAPRAFASGKVKPMRMKPHKNFRGSLHVRALRKKFTTQSHKKPNSNTWAPGSKRQGKRRGLCRCYGSQRDICSFVRSFMYMLCGVVWWPFMGDCGDKARSARDANTVKRGQTNEGTPKGMYAKHNLYSCSKRMATINALLRSAWLWPSPLLEGSCTTYDTHSSFGINRTTYGLMGYGSLSTRIRLLKRQPPCPLSCYGTIERTDEGVDRTTKGPTKCLQLEVGRPASINYSVIYFVGYGVICRINGEPCAFATWKRCRLLKPRLRLHSAPQRNKVKCSTWAPEVVTKVHGHGPCPPLCSSCSASH